MTFWIGILAGFIFAWFALKIGLYETWALFFNIIISIYLAIFLGPQITEIFSSFGNLTSQIIISVAATAIISFLVLQFITYVFFTSQFKIPFPKIINMPGSAILGFMGGVLVWSFISILVFATPIARNAIVQNAGFNSGYNEKCIASVLRYANIINNLISKDPSKYTAQQMISNFQLKAIENISAQNTDKNKSEKSVPETKGQKELQDTKKAIAPPPEIEVNDM